jgi:predicted nucleic acid-binding protein
VGAFSVVGLDTGIFYLLATEHPQAREIFEEVNAKRIRACVSCLCLYELTKLRHRGVIKSTTADALLAQIPEACDVLWLDAPAVITHAAGISHRNNIAMADALILASYLDAGCNAVYTVDPDFARCEGSEVDIVVVSP